MNWIRRRGPFLFILIVGVVALGFTLWDLLYEQGWQQQLVAGYIILILLTLVVFIVQSEKTALSGISNSVREFEKTLEGRLSHFQCPQCHGIFALKKSKENNQNPVKLMCPDCGAIGVIPATPQLTQAAIPEQKSRHAVFECTQCGETLTLWAEGVELYTGIRVFTCPYCGVEQSMSRL